MAFTHNDKLGREIRIGDAVVYPQSNHLRIGKVVKLNRVMVGIEDFKSIFRLAKPSNKYPKDVVVLDDNSHLTMYLLKN